MKLGCSPSAIVWCFVLVSPCLSFYARGLREQPVFRIGIACLSFDAHQNTPCTHTHTCMHQWLRSQPTFDIEAWISAQVFVKLVSHSAPLLLSSWLPTSSCSHLQTLKKTVTSSYISLYVRKLLGVYSRMIRTEATSPTTTARKRKC